MYQRTYRLVKKSTQVEILHRTRDEPTEYRGKQLVILKQVPRRVRELRRPYQFLTLKLIKYNINFRWLIREGIMILWQDKRHRLDTLDKAEEFYNQYVSNEEEVEEREERDSTNPSLS